MKDIMSTSNGTPPKEFTEYLHNLLEEIITNGESFDKYKKWLKKYCDEYDINYPHIESEIEDFIELINEYNNNSSKIVRKSLDKSGSNLFLKLNQVEQLVTKYRKKHPPKNTVNTSVNKKLKYDYENAKTENTVDQRNKEIKKKKLEEENNRKRELDDIRKREEEESAKTKEELKRNSIIFKVVGMIICAIIGLALGFDIMTLLGMLFVAYIVIFVVADVIFKQD